MCIPIRWKSVELLGSFKVKKNDLKSLKHFSTRCLPINQIFLYLSWMVYMRTHVCNTSLIRAKGAEGTQHLLLCILHHFGQQFGGGGCFHQLIPVLLSTVPCATLRTLHSSTTLCTATPAGDVDDTRKSTVFRWKRKSRGEVTNLGKRYCELGGK